MTIKIGPAGIGELKNIEQTFKKYNEFGIKAAEIPFTYGVYIKDEEDIKNVRMASEKFGISLSIHAPYWINLNSKDENKIEKSKERILKCCEVGERLGAKIVVFHAGYYSGLKEDESYNNIKNAIFEMQKFIERKGWKIKIAPETMGKNSVFGSFEQIYNLHKETKCSFCIDFAHILARDKKVNYEKIKKLFTEDKWHCHFTGIVYGEKGEKHHKKTEKEDWEKLLQELKKIKNKEIVIINEAPDPFTDSIEGIRILNL